MIEKTIMCPNCKNHIKIQGNPGEKIFLTCSKCETKGKFTFPGDRSSQNEDYYIALDIKNVTKTFNGDPPVFVSVSSYEESNIELLEAYLPI